MAPCRHGTGVVVVEIVHANEDAVDNPRVVEPSIGRFAGLTVPPWAFVFAVWSREHDDFTVKLELRVTNRAVVMT